MGFHASWANTRDVILPDIQILKDDHPDYELVLVGHSLGGAVAALAGLELLVMVGSNNFWRASSR